MCGGGTQQTTQSVQIPPEVLARYNQVNDRANTVAGTPFQTYSTDPSAFVAPLSATQTAGVAGTNAAAGQAQPYFDAATGQLLSATNAGLSFLPGAAADIGSAQAYGGAGASQALHSLQSATQAAAPLQAGAANLYGQGLAGAQPYNFAATSQLYGGLAGAQPLLTSANQNISGAQSGAQPYQALATGLGLGAAGQVDPHQIGAGQIDQFMSPYLGTVLNSTAALLGQENQQAQSEQLGNAVKSGAFGGDRAGIAAANLAKQQQLANAQVFSGILNQGYGQALGAAQQQQGVQLSADQANRAALAAASGNLAAIGQQGFGQGITTAQQQAALGQQQFGQGLGAAQGLQGIGNQLFGQNLGTGQAQAALGNQVYTQGANTAQQQQQIGNELFQQQLAASQAKQGLGQTAYSIGSGSAQALAGLGQGAQSAGLQGAQAQLAAGQVQQQTDQAGKTALYNQFLQQQSYPFQVAQFLANIAEGTGSLSGSTTTTTQPGGFFSDERLKTHIEPVGETYDGQQVVRYRYKGDPRWRMGLIAQDVEKKHPKAVGLAAGYKTVDYGKATDTAASRGHFADGGVAGFDPEIMRQILANQNGSYGPYVTTLGGMYGGQGRVPAANLPVGSLKTAGAAPQVRSPFENAKQIADLGTSVEKDVDEAKKGWEWVSSKMGHGEDPPYARGGLAGYADGGMPYSTGVGGLDIPDDKPQFDKLSTPGKAPQVHSGVDDAKTAADAALAVAKIAAMFMNAGGAVRGGYADGGSPDDVSELEDALARRDAGLERVQPPLDPKAFFRDFVAPHEGGLNPHDLNGSPTYMGFNQAANPDIDVTKLTPDTAAARFADKYYRPSGAANMAPGLAAAHADTYFMNPSRARQFLAASAGDPDKYVALRDAWFAHRAQVDPASAKYGKAWSRRDADLKTYADGLAPPAPDVSATAPSPAEAAQGPAPTGLAGARDFHPANDGVANDAGVAPPKKDLLHTLMERQNLIPLLDFIGAMGTAPTQHFGVALAAGLKGAAQGLEGQQQIGIKSRIADADVLQKTMGVATGRFTSIGNGMWRDNARGDIIPTAERMRRISAMSPGMSEAMRDALGAGSDAAPPEAASTSANAPTATASAAAPPKAVTPVAPPTEEESIYSRADANPQVKTLRERADKLAAEAEHFTAQAKDPYIVGTPAAAQNLEAANNARSQAQQALEQWRQLREQYAAPEIATLTEAKKAKFVRQNAAQQTAFERATEAQNTAQQSDAILANLKDPKTGRYTVNGGPLGESLMRASQIMTQFGVSPTIAQAITSTNPNDAAAVEKLRTTLGTEIGRQELQGSQVRVSEFQQFLRTTPGIDLPAAASEWILRNIIQPRAQQSIGLYEKVRGMDPLKEDVQGATFDFQKKNPWWNASAGTVSQPEAPKPTAKNSQGVLTPASPDEMKGQPKGTPFVVPSGPMKGQVKKWAG